MDLERELHTHVNTTHGLPPNDDDVQTNSNESLSEHIDWIALSLCYII